MKAASFDYVRVTTVEEACQALADGGEDARIIAGGQTLVPLMAMRLARPTLLIDINDVTDLSGISVEKNYLVIKAATRQTDALNSTTIQKHFPILTEALSHVGHTQTRNRGTVGGSLVNADPAAEIPLVAIMVDALLVAQSLSGIREIAAAEFFESAMATVLTPNECLVEVRFPIWESINSGHGFHEVSIRDSDFALAVSSARIKLGNSGICQKLNVAIGGASPVPLRLHQVENELVGKNLKDKEISKACDQILDIVDPQSDVHADASYRRRVVKILAERAIFSAWDNARSKRK